MASRGPPGRRRSPPAVAWILLLAVLVGVAAALLSRPVGSVAPGTPVAAGITLEQFAQICGVIGVTILALWVYLGFRNREGRTPLPERLVAAVLVTLLLGVLMVVVLQLVHVAPIANSGNSTSNPSHSGSPVNSTPTPPPSVFGPPGVTLPAWAGFAVLLGVAVLAAVLIVPVLLARAESRKRAVEESDGPARQAQAALQEALRRLESAGPQDARATILALYSRLLLLVGPRLGTVESRTPREIEKDTIAGLGVRPAVAQDLTETFEEARYSSHSMSLTSVERARAALTEAIADLARHGGTAP